MSPEDDTFGILRIRHGKFSKCEDVSDDPRPVANRFDGETVGRPVDIAEASEEADSGVSAEQNGHSNSNSQRFRTVVVTDALKFLCNLIQGFVPGDRNKIAILSHQGRSQAIF